MPTPPPSYLKFRFPTRSFKHYLLLTEAVELEYRTEFEVLPGYDTFITEEVPAGVYGFAMAIDRDDAVKRYNKSNGMIEVAFPLQPL